MSRPHTPQSASSTGSPGPPDREIGDRLAGFVAERTGASSVRVTRLARMAGGASRELWSVDLEIQRSAGSESLALVLRRDPPGRGEESDRGLEFRVLQAAAAVGVPVPRVHWCSTDPDVLGSSFFLMDRIEGETIPRRLLRDPEYAKTRAQMIPQLGAILARIHTVDLDQTGLEGLGRAASGTGSAHAEVERIATALRELAVEPHPVLDLAERWLLERAPEPARRVLVHGDYRVGNFLFDGEGVRAVLDWELSHAGDPVEDLGWLCVRAWRFGNDDLAAGGVGTREALVEAYEAAGGAAVDPETLRYWEACGNFKLALVFVMQARVYLDGARSVELASLGRRIAEPEAELLRLMQ